MSHRPDRLDHMTQQPATPSSQETSQATGPARRYPRGVCAAAERCRSRPLAITLFAQGEDAEAEAERVVDTTLAVWPVEALAEHLDLLMAVTVSARWDSGWQPEDVVRITARKVDDAAAAAAVEAIAVDTERYRRAPHPEPSWVAQLDRIGANRPGRRLTAQVEAGADPWRTLVPALAALSLLTRLHPLPKLLPPPDEWSQRQRLTRSRAGVDPKILDRVRALVAKAESTDFPEEAAAFTAKAQELITRHAVTPTTSMPSSSSLHRCWYRPPARSRRWGHNGAHGDAPARGRSASPSSTASPTRSESG